MVKVGPFLLVDAKLAKRGYVRDTKIAIVKNEGMKINFFWVAHPRKYLGLDING